jgi:hypothetical protein
VTCAHRSSCSHAETATSRTGAPAMALGATDALVEWADLFQEIERVLG